MRARELGIEVGLGTPGARNAITDVAGVLTMPMALTNSTASASCATR